MKARTALLSSLLLIPCSLAAQPTCRQASATAVEHTRAFTIYTVSLPTRPRPLVAKAFVPNAGSPGAAFVFSLSTLVGSDDPSVRVQMMPVATELATQGRPTIVLQRELTWPEVAKSVGHLQAEVLCAEQWLAAHAIVRPDDWAFVGPHEDLPTFEQLLAAGGSSSMTFAWGYPIAGPDDYGNTELVIHDRSLPVARLLVFNQVIEPLPLI